MELSVAMAGVPEAGAFSMRGEGVFDFAGRSGELAIDATAFRVEERIVDGVVYVRMPGGPAGSGDKWLRVDAASLGADASGLGLSGSGTDPSQILSYLAGLSDEVVEVGPDVVRGADVTHYRARIDLGRALDAEDIPAAARAQLEKLAGSLDGVELPVDVWIDRDGRMRRMTMEMDLAKLLGGSKIAGAAVPDGAAMRIEMELYDFGVPVHVEAPPADQIAG
jgi:hypothetical protein